MKRLLVLLAAAALLAPPALAKDKARAKEVYTAAGLPIGQ